MKYILDNQPREVKTNVVIGPEAFDELGQLLDGYTKIVVISDENVAEYCLEPMQNAAGTQMDSIVMPAGETNKNLSSAGAILQQLRELGCDRKSLVVGLGGGVVNDLAGFVASVYMRGVDWIMLPTTLTAQADASIGGKTGVNLGNYKNMVGTFWPPKAVLINPSLLSSLPKRHFSNGLAEIIKMGFIYDKNILEHVEKIEPGNILGEELNKAAELSAKAKVEIVNADMFENGERKLLNFGHTIGHGLESLALNTQQPLLHGEAIAIGMVAEAKLAELETVAEAGTSDKIAKLLQKFNLPTTYSNINQEDILKIIAADKKNVGTSINWTLPKEVGKGIYNHIASSANIEQAISETAL